MDRDPISGQQLKFERTPQRYNPIEGPDRPPCNYGDIFVAGFVVGGLIGAVGVYILERL